MLPTDLTVSAVVEEDGRFLIVEEQASGIIVINQPGGHIEFGESPEQAAVREAREEAGCEITINGLLGVYLWIHPQSRQNFLRVVFTADLVAEKSRKRLDEGVQAVHWYTLSDLRERAARLRSPVVLRCVEDYLNGLRQPESMLEGLQPIQQHVDKVLANAHLV